MFNRFKKNVYHSIVPVELNNSDTTILVGDDDFENTDLVKYIFELDKRLRENVLELVELEKSLTKIFFAQQSELKQDGRIEKSIVPDLKEKVELINDKYLAFCDVIRASQDPIWDDMIKRFPATDL